MQTARSLKERGPKQMLARVSQGYLAAALTDTVRLKFGVEQIYGNVLRHYLCV